MNNITILIPTPLRTYTDNQKKINIEARTVKAALNNLVKKYPQLKNHLFDGQDASTLRNFVNVYLNDSDIRYLDLKVETEVTTGDTLMIIPSIAGGKP